MATAFELLESEWRRLGRDRSTARRLPEVCAAAGGVSSLADVERYVRQASPAEADQILLLLVTRAVTGDELAARALLQLLIPGTRAMAHRWWAIGDPEERAAAAVAAVYQRIRTYPLERRPGRVAANVLMDAARDLRRSVPRVVSVPSADPATGRMRGTNRHQAPEPTPEPAVELAEILQDSVSQGVLRADDAHLIARSRIAGDSVADIAERRGLHPRTLWDRRHRAEQALVAAHAHHRRADAAPLADQQATA